MHNRTLPSLNSERRVASSILLLSMIASAGLGIGEGLAQPGHVDVLDPHALPLGDGKVSAEPRRGYVFSCQTRFRGGGAQHAGDWIHGSTWDATKKIAVQGEVAWPEAAFAIATQGGQRRVAGNGLPMDHTTGIFPVRPGDPAYRIDRNPNAISARQMVFSLPLTPVPAAQPGCVPMGMIGVALDGVAIFNALDAAGRDAVAHEVQDRCNGHPERRGEYHYHGPTACIPGATARNALVGYALDGFGIYSLYDENGRELTNADLDECHGRLSRIRWDGKEVTMYHYVLTREYPYTVGCLRGTAPGMQDSDDRALAFPPVGPQAQGEAIRKRPLQEPREGPPRAGHRPPAEAIGACAGQSSGSRCRFISPRGDEITGTCRMPGDALACVPEMRAR
jgi:hypothetical protein